MSFFILSADGIMPADTESKSGLSGIYYEGGMDNE